MNKSVYNKSFGLLKRDANTDQPHRLSDKVMITIVTSKELQIEAFRSEFAKIEASPAVFAWNFENTH